MNTDFCGLHKPRLGLYALSAFMCAALFGCGSSPKHLDEGLANQLLANALGDAPILVAIHVSTPSAEDRASIPPDFGLATDIDPNDPSAPKRPRHNEAMAALTKTGYVFKRYRRVPGPSENPSLRGDVVAIYVLTHAGKAASKAWKHDGPYAYTAMVGKGYKVSYVRNIRFSRYQGAYYGTLDYDAAPFLNSLGRTLASANDAKLVTRTHTATMLLLDDGWAVSRDGL